MNQEIKILLEKSEALKLAKDEYEKARINAQILCKHANVVEGEYDPGGIYVLSSPPFRVCKDCGYAEEGWGCGYSFLKEDIGPVSRVDALKFLKGKVIRNEDHRDVRLGRKDLKEILK